MADARVVEVDMQDATAEVNGQEIMTADKVTLRLNAVVTDRAGDAARAVASVGIRDVILPGDRRGRIVLLRFSCQTLCLTGPRFSLQPSATEKGLMSKVTEARKAAEANFHLALPPF